MLKTLVLRIMVPLLLLFSNSSGNLIARSATKSADGTGTLERMIVADGSVAMDLNLQRLNGAAPDAAQPALETLNFGVSPNSFFTLIVFNDLLRGPEPGSLRLVRPTP